MKLTGPVWLMQPIPYWGERLTGEWIVEEKIDGWRAQWIKINGKLSIWGRRLEKKPNWTERLLYLVNILNPVLPDYTLLDSELYSSRGRRFIPSIFSKNRKAEPIIYIFDIIFYMNRCLSTLPLIERKGLLQKINLPKPFHFLTYHRLRNIRKQWKEYMEKGAEGIIIKKIDSEYLIGKGGPLATQNWRKIKEELWL